jgi:hypothetical protein
MWEDEIISEWPLTFAVTPLLRIVLPSWGMAKRFPRSIDELSPAGRLQAIAELLYGIPEFDEDGCYVGRSVPIITEADAVRLIEEQP